MAWSAPRTWVTGELVTSPIMNQHIRDNLFVIRAEREGIGVFGSREAAPIVDGADHLFSSSSANDQSGFGAQWATLTAQGTVQWRILTGFNLTAVGTCTALTYRTKVFREVAAAGGATWTEIWTRSTPTDFALSTGWKTFDSGWGTGALPTGDTWGVYLPGYHFDFTTGTPTIVGLSTAMLLRVV